MSGKWLESAVSSSDDSSDEHSGGKFVRAPEITSKCRPKSRGRAITSGSTDRRNDCENVMKREWLSGSWPLKQFDGLLPPNERKAEWIRFRDQFERIASCKAPVDQRTKLTGMKIFAGDYLLNVIEMQEKLVREDVDGVYEATIRGINRFFEQTCDTTKERMKFREMFMKATEPFTDWVLRLELQAKFCDFGAQQREEEFIQALLRRSVPEIAGKLYEMSDLFGNNLERIISHGKHLDYIRTEAKEMEKATQVKVNGNLPEGGSSDGSEVQPVNAVYARKKKFGSVRYEPYRGSRPASRSRDFQERKEQSGMPGSRCSNCGRVHDPDSCKAFRAKCFYCKKVGHFAAFCGSSGRDSNTRQRSRDRKQDVRRFGIKDETAGEVSRINQVNDEISHE